MKALFSGLLILFPLLRSAAQCTDDVPFFTPSTQPGWINWDQFPDFDLPFTVVYQGPRGNDTTFIPLRRGFSHLAKFNSFDFAHLPPEKRAILFGRVATPNQPQPWGQFEIPWNNDMEVYENHWQYLFNQFFGNFYDYHPANTPNADLIVADIESARYLSEIPEIQNHPAVPPALQQLGDLEFLLAYREDMVRCYSEALHFLKETAVPSAPLMSSYYDTPILRYWDEIPNLSWSEWSNSPYPLNYLMLDTASLFSYGPVYHIQDFLTPSAYYFYDYPDERAGDYIAYLLFQLEANRSRSDKDLIPFVWLNYHNCCADSLKNIRPYMAEASAIFPLMSGASGVWVWDHRKNESLTDTADLSNYEYFVKGLYRMSQYKDYFTDCHGLISDDLAYNHFVQHTPIWRAVVQGNKILVAANNPYAEEGAYTDIPVTYKGWNSSVFTTGKETALCEFTWAPEWQALTLDPGSVLWATDTLAASYHWSTGETTPGIIPPSEGLYAVTITDIYGCTYIQSFAVSFPPVTSAEFTHETKLWLTENILSTGEDLQLRTAGVLGDCEVGITTQSGVLLWQRMEEFEASHVSIPIGPLPGGMYRLSIRHSDWVRTFSFVMM